MCYSSLFIQTQEIPPDPNKMFFLKTRHDPKLDPNSFQASEGVLLTFIEYTISKMTAPHNQNTPWNPDGCHYLVSKVLYPEHTKIPDPLAVQNLNHMGISHIKNQLA